MMNNNTACISSSINIENYLDNSHQRNIREEIHKGLTASQKYLPSKHFYDSRGSQLFEEICRLPEYYLTRTEMALLKEASPEIMRSFKGGDLIELGSGANWKIRMLLDVLDEKSLSSIRYVPVDVSRSALISASDELRQIFPKLDVLGIVADFVHHMDTIPDSRPRIIIFFGSTIGNFNEEESRNFLNSVAGAMKPEDRFLLGIDMLKPKEVIEPAYNDHKGITADFNKNILNVINEKLNADFNPSHFDHLAFFNEEKEQIEMHLKTNRKISVNIADLKLKVDLVRGETIHTEICRKFSREKTERMIAEAGLNINSWYSDPKRWFSLLDLSTE